METIIIADNRERTSGIPEILTEKKIHVSMKQLVAGDYIIDDEIVIERKASSDFVQSIINGRLFSQCARLRKTLMIPLIIVEGNPYKTRHDINPEAIKGALLSVSLRWQIPIIRSSGREDTAELMIMALNQHNNPPVFIARKATVPRKKQNQMHFFIEGLPGVGPALAQRLLAYFSTIEQMILADIKTLKNVEGIGKTKATKLYDLFRSKSYSNV
ncbi:MAG: helix-hairpin-helix domain-containing protein [Bacteroidales bacterium]|nr:helix-hairpin-helix domain-containing protein [Bacteroidales bacterium]